ncbi:amino acid ABC transporter permease protein 2 [Listeria innocua FSL J1-023]|nr:amino acid ABC transporter permease protein 2 [Listeria innocua FSL J1-023]
MIFDIFLIFGLVKAYFLLLCYILSLKAGFSTKNCVNILGEISF